MILVALSWGWIGITSFLVGFAVMEGIGKVTGRVKPASMELHILMGLLCLTVYVQVFSLFGGVGKIATLLLAVVSILLLVTFRKKIVRYIVYMWTKIRGWGYGPCLLAVLIVLLLVYITAGNTWHYDTDLYHAQAIRWIEQFGVVKGLGNLHNRFAYNSAFFCLQALFSLKFAINQSLHSLNGFVAAVMLCYAAGTLNIWRKERLTTSDFYKIGIFIYFSYLENSLLISSPGSDLLTLCMVLYISAKWAELIERQEREPVEYGILCLLAVWTVTIKLSAGLLVFLAVYPAVTLIRQKRWKEIFFFLGVGVLVVAPFLIRNVYVSGYLVYPYSSLDFFNVDWKMAASVAADDSREIMAWGRGMTSRTMYDADFSIWFPRWFDNQQGMIKTLFLFNIVCMVILAGYSVRIILRKRKDCGASMLLLSVSAAQVIMWFVTAPLIRYGLTYMLLLPAFLLGLICHKINSRVMAWAICVAGIYCGTACIVQVADNFTETYWKRPADYNWREARSVVWENMEVYVPEGSDCIGYHYFPSTPHASRLEAIELRTGNLEGGFRLKEEYREKEFNSMGVVVGE